MHLTSLLRVSRGPVADLSTSPRAHLTVEQGLVLLSPSFIMPSVISTVLLSVLLLLSLFPFHSLSAYCPSTYDVDWTSPSTLESQSMPLGNGDLALSVWVNASDGSLQYYAQPSSSFDENGQLLKLIRGRISFNLDTSSPPRFSSFHHHLHIANASQTISFQSGQLSVFAVIYVDRYHQVVRFHIQTSPPSMVSNSIEMWRTTPTTMGSNWQGGYYCDERFVYPDRLANSPAGTLTWYHRNDGDLNNSMYEAALRQQNLTGIGLENINPLVNRTWGGYLVHDDTTSWGIGEVEKQWYGQSVSLRRSQPVSSFSFSLFPHTEEWSTVAEWQKRLTLTVQQVQAIPEAIRLSAHRQYWSDFYNRSHVEITLRNDSATTFLLNQVVLLQRMTDAMCGQNDYPIHFNGEGWNIGEYSDSPQGPDHRQWGSAFWWQNIRMSYYPAAPAGDFDLLTPLFRFYQRTQHVQETRIRQYYGHSGAYWDETLTMYGLMSNGQFGYQCTGNEQIHGNPWIRLHWDGSFELCLLMVQYYHFTQDETFALQTLIPVCSAVMDFFYQHFPGRDESNHTDFFPSQSLETWQCNTFGTGDRTGCPTNAIIYVSGMQATLTALLALPSPLVSDELRAMWTSQFIALPPLPKGQCQANTSQTCLLPAAGGWHPGVTNNTENVELYTVWPYAQYGVALADYSTILSNYNLRPFPCNDGWCQDVVDAAMLGLRDETAKQVIERVHLAPAVGWKFPTFNGPLQDSTPADDHFNVLRVAVQSMLVHEVSAASMDWAGLRERMGEIVQLEGEENGVQAEGTKLLLFAALPLGWDAEFKLWAQGPTVIEGTCFNNTLTSLVVTPESRRKDIVLLGCTNKEGSSLDATLHETAERVRNEISQQSRVNSN